MKKEIIQVLGHQYNYFEWNNSKGDKNSKMFGKSRVTPLSLIENHIRTQNYQQLTSF